MKLTKEATTWVTRLEVIDETGRAFTRHGCAIELHLQDEGRTLKVFVTPRLEKPAEDCTLCNRDYTCSIHREKKA